MLRNISGRLVWLVRPMLCPYGLKSDKRDRRIIIRY